MIFYLLHFVNHFLSFCFSCIDRWFEVNRSCPEHPGDQQQSFPLAVQPVAQAVHQAVSRLWLCLGFVALLLRSQRSQTEVRTVQQTWLPGLEDSRHFKPARSIFFVLVNTRAFECSTSFYITVSSTMPKKSKKNHHVTHYKSLCVYLKVLLNFLTLVQLSPVHGKQFCFFTSND